MKPDFTLKLLEWNSLANDRQMPWKGESDPYKVWLSEIILQQTRVDQGTAYFEKFISAFPTVHDLANAEDSRVFKMWEGLGYYTRCKNLLVTARAISAEHGGKFPDTYAELLKLKGIGPYTAAAIASFAFNENCAVVDGNVQRVIARYFGISTPIDAPMGKKLFTEIASSLINGHSPAIYNQAIMDFGATICKPKKPLCGQCIQALDCQAFNHDFVNRVPVKEKILRKRTRWFYYFIIEVNDSVYIRRREGRDIWQNLHEFVLLETDEPEDGRAAVFLNRLLPARSFSVKAFSGPHSQQLTHQRINGGFFVVHLSSEVNFPGNYQLVKMKKLNDYAFPKFINSYLESKK